MALLPSRTRKGTGCLVRREDTGRELSALRLPLVVPPKTFLGNLKNIPVANGNRMCFDQGPANSCVAEAVAMALVMEDTRDGLPLVIPSSRFLYYWGRRITGHHLRDGGSYIDAVATAANRFGYCEDYIWPRAHVSWKVNRRPTWRAERHAHDLGNVHSVGIFDRGEARLLAMKQAILAGHSVVFGTSIDARFMKKDASGFIYKPTGMSPIKGRHAMVTVGWQSYRGREWWLVQNSWGRGWRDDGMCWMDSEYMKWEETKNLRVIYGSRKVVAS